MTRLEQLRLDAGLSRVALGERAGVSGMTIRRIESGRVRPYASTLKAIADALGEHVSASELLQAALLEHALP